MPLNKDQQARFDAVCETMADGKSLRAACKGKKDISKPLVMRWLADSENGDLVDQYRRAREAQGDAMADQIIENSNKRTIDDDTTKVNRDRLRFDERRWLAGKLRPKKYGDKLDLDVKADVNTSVELVISPHELIQERLAQIAKRSGNDS